MKRIYNDIVGRMFGFLDVLRECSDTEKRKGLKRFKCQCTYDGCKNIVYATGWELVKKGKSSCGCIRENNKNTNGGLSIRFPREYQAYCNMMYRCYNPKNKSFHNYGGKGITVCKRWKEGSKNKTGFMIFMEDMGPKPSIKHSIDRKNNEKGYNPNNCRWATAKIQANNRRPRKPRN